MKKIIIALIALMVFSQCVSAGSGGSTVNIDCPPVTISAVTMTDNDVTTTGFQVDPEVPNECIDVVKCDATPKQECCDNCGCFYVANGSYVGDGGTHCATGFGPGYQPTGVIPCNYIVPSCNDSPWNNGCDFDANAQWVGNNAGGYAYDVDDGYKMGLKQVRVNVTINTSGGIKWLCTTYLDGGIVTMKVDNYDSQKGTRQVYSFGDPPECSAPEGVYSATWTGYFYMHYWEKPGIYAIDIDAESCCEKKDTTGVIFEYMPTSALCIAPPGKNIDYGNVGACGIGTNATAYGDVITSTCEQCDLCSEPPTLRNIGNTMVNLEVYATDMTSGNGDIIPVSKVGLPYVQGNLFINVDTSWNDLQNIPETITLPAQEYCNHTVTTGCPSCLDQVVYDPGLPPGPHATNNISLMMMPIPCVPPGQYSNAIYISAKPAVDVCCQDHREPYFGSSLCITPPQCYEIPGRYPYGTPCASQVVPP